VEVVVLLVALIVLDVVALRCGADSRDGFRVFGAGGGAGGGGGGGEHPQCRVRVWWAEPASEGRRAEAGAPW
jgi:hypothetical protein